MNQIREDKKQELIKLIDNYTNQNIVIAFSGGVDSTLLLKIACDLASKKNNKVYAFTIHTTLHPMNEVEASKKIAEEFGAIHNVIHVDELQNAGVLDNPVDRCYLCKKFLFTNLREIAQNLQVDIIMDGTNEDDLHVYRPGIQALKEIGVLSPLAMVHMTKDDIRTMAKEYGISVAMKPSAPCLATRFPYGTHLSYEGMKQVEQAEEFMKTLGFYNVRIRVHEDIARIEVDSPDIFKLVENRENIISKLKSLGYQYITVDLEGFRSGSMDYKVI